MQEGDQPWVYGEYQCRAIAVGGRYWKELNITVGCAREYIMTLVQILDQG